MPRRVYTYPAGLGWDALNLISTVGAFMLAAGVLVFLLDLVQNLRPTLSDQAGDVWGAGTLEWLDNDAYASRSIPHVLSREPLWDQPGLREDVEAGRYYLPGAPTGRRETIVTSPIEAEPQYLARLPGPGWTPVLAAVFTAAFFLLLTVKLVTLGADLRRARRCDDLGLDVEQRSGAGRRRSTSAAACGCRPTCRDPRRIPGGRWSC